MKGALGMSIAGDLFLLQELDSALDARARELEQVRAEFGDSGEAAEARAELVGDETRLRAAAAQTRELETQLSDLAAKSTPVEQHLYDGSVRNPKELQSLQDELAMFQRQRRALEDQQIAALEEHEVAAAAVRAAGQRVDELERSWRDQQGNLTQREHDLTVERDRLREQRRLRAARIDPARMVLYDRLRTSKRGVAVAKTERGVCLGCRITLPTTITQRARSGQQIVQCTSCERILYAG